jgi:hypothetical protein
MVALGHWLLISATYHGGRLPGVDALRYVPWGFAPGGHPPALILATYAAGLVAVLISGRPRQRCENRPDVGSGVLVGRCDDGRPGFVTKRHRQKGSDRDDADQAAGGHASD